MPSLKVYTAPRSCIYKPWRTAKIAEREEIFFDDGRQVFFVDFDLALDETLIFVVLDWKNDAHVFILPAVFSYRLAHAGDSSSSNITQLG